MNTRAWYKPDTGDWTLQHAEYIAVVEAHIWRIKCRNGVCAAGTCRDKDHGARIAEAFLADLQK